MAEASKSQGRPSPDAIDIPWLRSACALLFSQNRAVRPAGAGAGIPYHAPSLARDRSFGFSRKYPHQWFWDSCAHAIALSHLDLPAAEQEVLSLLAAQDEQGFIPHQIFNPAMLGMPEKLLLSRYDRRLSSRYLQPPVLAQAVEALQRQGSEPTRLQPMLEGLKRYYRYIRRTRVRGDDGLAEIIHPYESGKDRSREYDAVFGRTIGLGLKSLPLLRLVWRHRALGWDLEAMFNSNAFRVKDLLFNCAYAANLRAMHRLCSKYGQAGDAAEFDREAGKVEASILQKMYHPRSGLFFSLDAREGRDEQIPVSTVSTLLPLLLESIDREPVRRLVQHLTDPGSYWPPYPVPSEPLGCPEAEWGRTAIWRGLQTWMFPNWFILYGLLRQAERFPEMAVACRAPARHLAYTSYDMVRRSGFREFYHSVTGEGARARGFGHSALVLDMAYMVHPRG